MDIQRASPAAGPRVARPFDRCAPAPRWASACATASVAALGLALATPLDLAPAALMLFVAAAGLGSGRLAAVRAPLRPVAWMAVGVVALVCASIAIHDAPLRELDGRARILLMPLAAAAVAALGPSRRALWWGAFAGLAAAAAIAGVEALAGVERADGWSHPLVFAIVVTGLVAIVLFCRPPGRLALATLGAALGVVAIGLSGSRGAWLGVAVIVVASLAAHAGRMRRASLGVAAGLCVALLAAWSLPPVAERARLQELHRDLDRYAEGDGESSFGARLTLYRIAVATVVAEPWVGVGVGGFGRAVRAQPECIAAPRRMACTLGHAHNDALEWGATMGVPGLVAWLALFAAPLWIFVRALRRVPGAERPRSAALAGVALVLAFAACGLTQSLFAHQLTATFYALATGALLGFALREGAAVSRSAAPAPAATA